MKNSKKLFLIATFLVILTCFLAVNTPTAKAVTVEEILSQITELRAQIAQLQQQLTEIQGEEVWCYNFNVNLRIEMRGAKVRALQTALQKEGFEIPSSETEGEGYFGIYTASAVVQFQEKYASEILASWGLTTGTGYVGLTTRAKLNELYGCGAVQPYIKVTSPNGGETWKIGETRAITWSTTGYDSTASIQIGLRDTRYDPNLAAGEATIVNTTNTGNYTWTIPADPSDLGFETFGAGNVYKIVIYIAGGGPGKFDLSNSNFSIVSATAEKSITVISPNGGEEWEIGGTYDIKWQSSGLEKVNINLYDSSRDHTYGIADNIQASLGSYQWTISSIIQESSNYQIQISGSYKGSAFDESDNYFSIVEAETCHTTPLWSWTYCSSGCKCNAGEGDCDTDADCTTGYCAQNVGAKYGQVSGMDVCEEKVEKSITVISPNGGEEWEIGGTYDIKWQSSGLEKVNINLYDSSRDHTYGIADNIQASLGSYQWTISSIIQESSNYQIQISGSYKGSAFDESDNYFSIVSSTTACNSTDMGDFKYDVYEEGTTTYKGESKTDYCMNSVKLKEYFCDYTMGTSWLGDFEYDCPNGCENGACIKEKSITVISPNGGEEWERGSIQKIIWNYEPLPPNKFKINLANANSDTVVTNLKSCGIADVHQDSDQPTKFWWNWKVGDNAEGITIPALGPYRIMVDDCEEIKDFSDASFTMVNPSEKSITVTSPNGGEAWKIGETRAITWSTTGYDSTASIQIGLRDTRYDPNLAAGEATIVNTTNTGNYTWTIPADPSDLGFETFGAGNVYKIVIYIAGGGPGKYDLSDNNFSIVSATAEKSINILSPSGREEWELGKTYNIVWESSGYTSTDKIRVAIVDYTNSANLVEYDIVYNLAANVGLYSWTIPSNFNIGSNYKIKVEICGTTKCYSDLSDDYFSIVEQVLGLKNIEKQLTSFSDTISNLIKRIKELIGE